MRTYFLLLLYLFYNYIKYIFRRYITKTTCATKFKCAYQKLISYNKWEEADFSSLRNLKPMTDVAELEEAGYSFPLFHFPLACFCGWPTGAARPTFPTFPISPRSGYPTFAYYSSVARGSPFIRETSSFSRSDRRILRRRMPKNLERPLTSRGRRKDRDDVETKFGEGPLSDREQLL